MVSARLQTPLRLHPQSLETGGKEEESTLTNSLAGSRDSSFDRRLSTIVLASKVDHALNKLKHAYNAAPSNASLRAEIQQIGDTQVNLLAVVMSLLLTEMPHGIVVKNASVVVPEKWLHLLTFCGLKHIGPVALYRLDRNSVCLSRCDISP